MPQSGAIWSRSAGTWRSAALIRAATVSTFSTAGVAEVEHAEDDGLVGHLLAGRDRSSRGCAASIAR